MIRNYLKTALRSIFKNKTSSVINVLGLTIGLTCCLLIGLYIEHELNYDNFDTKGERIARVIMEYKFDGGAEFKKGNFTSVRVAKVFKQTFPEVENAVKMSQANEIVQYKDKLINEKSLMYTDPSFFDVFSYKLLEGDAKTALNAPYKIVMTESAAKKYFGNEEPVGKTLKLEADTNLYVVTALMQDRPENSQVKFDMLVSFSSMGLEKAREDSYWDANYTTYLLLKDKSSIKPLQAKIGPFMQKEMAGKGASVNFDLEPFKKVHLYSEFDGFEPNNSITYIHILEGVALLILIIACFTYINLNTARSIERAREVGVRKVIGAEKGQLFWQFIGESLMICTLSTLLSIVLAMFLLPVFNQLTDKSLHLSSFLTPQFIVGVLMLIVAISLLAGSYPALILSNFQPVKVLKGSFKNTGAGQWVRKSLIVFQFAISVVLIITTFVMQNQLHFILNKKLGYDREHVLVMTMGWNLANAIPLIKQEFKTNTHVKEVAACYATPVNIVGGYNMRSSAMPETQQLAVAGNPIDQDYVKATGLKLVAGSDLTEQDIKDASYGDPKKDVYRFILNESAARELGWTPEKAVGQRMYLDAHRPGFVKGVVKDFNFESLHTAIKPLVLFPQRGGRRLLVKISCNDMPATIAFLGSKWKELVKSRPFEYHFMDEDFNKLYNSELRLGTVLNVFAGIAIALACLGLLGLSSYTAKQRVKEIGIRKVLGASVGNIATMLSGDFIKLVLVAIVISTPIAFALMNKWLQSFAYKINLSWWMFAVAGLAAVIIAALTVSFQVVKAALVNPVKNLRTE